MKGLPRLLPLLAIAVAGVLAINLVEHGPGIVGAARALAEGASKASPKTKNAKVDDNSPQPSDGSAATAVTAQAVPAKPAPICAPTAAELAKEAGLSPAELQVLQSLGARRGQLDQREQGLDTQLALISAAEVKLEARIAAFNALKADMQGLLTQVDAKQQAEVDRLVKVYSAMKPAAAAERFTLLSDPVRLPIAASMKERTLSAIIAQMPPQDAKALTESLAARFSAQQAAARQALNPPPAAAATPAPAPAPAAAPAQIAQAGPPPAADKLPTHPKPKPAVHHKPKPKAAAKPTAVASALPKPGASAPAVTPAKPTASAAPAAGPPAKAG
ncbi:MAG: MotE family protein [Caulobacterales bacterium]